MLFEFVYANLFDIVCLRQCRWTLLLLLLLFYVFSIMFAQLVSDHCRFETIERTGDLDAVPACSNTELVKHWPDLVVPRPFLDRIIWPPNVTWHCTCH